MSRNRAAPTPPKDNARQTRGTNYTVEQLREVAQMAFNAAKKNTEIARELHEKDPATYGDSFDRHDVEDMLRDARNRGIVTISFPPNVGEMEALQSELKERFEFLDEVTGIPNVPGETYESLLSRWGSVAARYFEREARQHDCEHGKLRVGVTGGKTLNAFVNAISPEERHHVDIHTLALVGRGHMPEPKAGEKKFAHINPIVNATLLWMKSGGIPGRLHYATITPYPSTLSRTKLREELDKANGQPEIHDAVKQMSRVDLAFVGLGEADSDEEDRLDAQLTMTQLLNPIISLNDLRTEKAAGDLGYNLFRKDGSGDDKWRFFLTPEVLDEHGKPRFRGVDFYHHMVEIDKIASNAIFGIEESGDESCGWQRPGDKEDRRRGHCAGIGKNAQPAPTRTTGAIVKALGDCSDEKKLQPDHAREKAEQNRVERQHHPAYRHRPARQ